MLRVAIVGSRVYTNKRKMKDLIFKLKQRYGDEVEIVSGGQPKGADGIAKKIALEFDMKYVEFPPAHFHWNQHCVKSPDSYGKKYQVRYFFLRNQDVVDYSDVILAFIPKGEASKGTRHTLKLAEKANKKVLVFD